jgi:DNA-binding CsgD family transcriptional regulator
VHSERTVLEAIGRIYDAAGDASRWPAFLEGFADAVNGLSATLLSVDLECQRGSLQASVRVDPADQKKYDRYYGGVDHWVASARPLLKTGTVLTSELYCPGEELARTEFYNDFLRPLNIFHNLAGIIFSEQSLMCAISTYRSKMDGAFGDEETSLLRVLVPHLQRSIQLHRRIVGLETKSQAIADALDRLPVGLILVDGRGKVIFVNRAARAILDQKDGLSSMRDGLAAARSDETARLRRMLHETSLTTSGKGFQSGGVIAVSRPSLKRPLQVLVTPLASNGFELGRERPAAAIFVSDPESEIEPDAEVLRRLFGLTGAEARLAALLMRGKSLEGAAEELGVSRATVRTQLQRTFDKTDTRRQGQLVRLLLSSPARIRSSAKP